MFSGIIEFKSTVKAISKLKTHAMKIEICPVSNDLKLGESVAVNGVCLTVTEKTHPDGAIFDVSPETLTLTNLKFLNTGEIVNIERALKISDRLSGHYVQGHVDGLGTIQTIDSNSDFHKIAIQLADTLSRYCVKKGSISINGVSLTINDVSTDQISILVIPHTWSITNFSDLTPGSIVNIEIDILAKYVEKLCRSK